jgi:hypothetical protein
VGQLRCRAAFSSCAVELRGRAPRSSCAVELHCRALCAAELSCRAVCRGAALPSCVLLSHAAELSSCAIGCAVEQLLPSCAAELRGHLSRTSGLDPAVLPSCLPGCPTEMAITFKASPPSKPCPPSRANVYGRWSERGNLGSGLRCLVLPRCRPGLEKESTRRHAMKSIVLTDRRADFTLTPCRCPRRSSS